MAIAESILRIGLRRRVAERTTPISPELKLSPIEQFTRNEALDLAKAYRNNLWHRRQSYSDWENARLSGTIEVQKLALETMGQHHIAGMRDREVRAVKMDESDLTVGIGSFSERDVRKLEKIYRDSRSFFVDHKLADKEWVKLEPSEMRIYARMSETGRVLDTLGQKDLVIAINNSFIPPSDRTDWAQNRSTGYGELQ